MKKCLSMLVLSFALVLLSAVGPKGAMAAPASDSKPIELIYSNLYPETHPRGEMSIWAAKQIQKFTNDRIKIKLYLGGNLVPTSQEFDACQKGTTDMGTLIAIYFEGKLPTLMAINALSSYSIPDSAAIYEDIRPLLDQEFGKRNMKYLWGVNSGSLILGSKKPVRTVHDLKGLKIRAGGGSHSDWVKILGGAPVSLTIAEAYMALRTGVVDGILTGYDSYLDLKLYEVAPNVTVIGDNGSSILTVINLSRFNSLSKEDQDAIMSVAKHMSNYCLGALLSSEALAVSKLKTVGATIIPITPAEADNFRSAVKSQWEGYLQRTGDTGKKFLSVTQKYR